MNLLELSPALTLPGGLGETAMATKTNVRRGAGWIGGMTFLAKPADLKEVLACLKQHLGGEQR